MIKTFYTIENGKIARVQAGEQPAGEGDWNEAPIDWGGAPGDKLTWFDSTMHRVPDPILVEQGKLINNRGRWYHKDKTGETKQIYGFDEEPGEDYTQEEPIQNEAYQKFDRQTGHWVVDVEKKERAEKEQEIAQIKAQIENAERKIIRPLRAIQMDRATNKDIEKFNEYDTLIENELRPELNRLESELQSA